MKKLQFTALVAAACFGFTGAAFAQDAKSKLDEVLARGTLVMGTGSTNAPWHFKAEDGTLLVGMGLGDAHAVLAKIDPKDLIFENYMWDQEPIRAYLPPQIDFVGGLP